MISGTIPKEHHKHAKLARPAGGTWGRLEVALLGAPCAVIEKLAAQISSLLPGRRTGYVDATHGETPEGEATPVAVLLTQADGHAVVRLNKPQSGPGQRMLFNDCDLVLVNGNHFTAAQQIVVLHPDKSLENKGDRLTDVKLVITATQATSVPDSLQAAFQDVPRIASGDTDGLAAFFNKLLNQPVPPLDGLVLAGGQSQRMGSDKSLLQYHAKPQRTHAFELLTPLCRNVFISCNAAQAGAIEYPKIEDRFLGIGPVAGILSAFQSAPDAAWLTVATDLPNLSSATLQYLIAHRNPSGLATAFAGADGLPEPLITIWEPRAYPVLLQALGMGLTCPRKVLITGNVALLTPPAADELQNINLPAEQETAMAAISGAAVLNSL